MQGIIFVIETRTIASKGIIFICIFIWQTRAHDIIDEGKTLIEVGH